MTPAEFASQLAAELAVRSVPHGLPKSRHRLPCFFSTETSAPQPLSLKPPTPLNAVATGPCRIIGTRRPTVWRPAIRVGAVACSIVESLGERRQPLGRRFTVQEDSSF
jgi:hypothetical protein